MDVITASTGQKPETFVSEEPLKIDVLTAKQKSYIKWLATIPADGKAVKNGRINSLPDRVANIRAALSKHIKIFKGSKTSAEKWGQVFAIKGLRRGLWLHLEALAVQAKNDTKKPLKKAA